MIVHPASRGRPRRDVRPLAHRPQSFRLHEFHPERIGEAGDDVNLQLAELRPFAVESVGPDLRPRLGRDQPGVNLDLIAEPAHAALHEIAHAEIAADLFGADRLVLEGESGAVRDHEDVGEMRQIRRQVVGDPVGEIVLFRVDLGRSPGYRIPSRITALDR